jgi:hypothetical protein
MHQTKLESGIESVVNQITGIATAFVVWRYVVIPLWGIDDPGFINNIGITLTFTAVSILRSYLWRRFFNAGLHKAVHGFITKKKIEEEVFERR